MKKFNPEIHRRMSIRLKGYDYSSPGVYFVTICAKNREHLFGEIKNDNIDLSDHGKIIKKLWTEIPLHFLNVITDKFVVMPNHIHGFIRISRNLPVGVQNLEPLHRNKFQHIIPKSLGSIIRGFKTGVTKWSRNNSDIFYVWQRNYYEHIIRNRRELTIYRKYIIKNPENWKNDEYYK